MSEFDSIRPYCDAEVSEVLSRIIGHPDLPSAAAKFVMPDALAQTVFGAWATRLFLRNKMRNITSVAECQQVIAEYFEKLIKDTSFGVTVTGLEQLNRDQCYLFTSNHRDIVLDSGLLNYYIHQAGHETCRMAVGDNLLEHDLAADLMKLNKSFVVHRGARGTREGYRILTRTSKYIRDSLADGVSVWIAQKEGRAKDGWDRTDPALLKMLSLGYRDSAEPLNTMVEDSQIVPVSISYELDPCASAKALELHRTAVDGSYAKSAEEDVESIITGLIGKKGRIHLNLGDPIRGDFESPQALAETIDEGILGGMCVFPTHVEAARLSGEEVADSTVSVLPESLEIFGQELGRLESDVQPYYLLQYANLIRNRRDIGLG
jgi:hypothetical protein